MSDNIGNIDMSLEGNDLASQSSGAVESSKVGGELEREIGVISWSVGLLDNAWTIGTEEGASELSFTYSHFESNKAASNTAIHPIFHLFLAIRPIFQVCYTCYIFCYRLVIFWHRFIRV